MMSDRSRVQGPIPSHSAAAADYGAILANAETDELVDRSYSA